MKNHIRKLLYIIVACATVIASVPFATTTFAAGNTLYFSPASQSMNINATFTVNVRAYVETSASRGTAAGTVTYPTSQLKVVATSTAGSTYGSPVVAPSPGAVGFNASASPGPSGITQVFTITFQAIGAGTATIGFSGDSNVNNVATNRNTGSFAITNPNPAPAPSTPSAPRPSPTPVAPSAPIVSTPPPAVVETPPTQTEVEDNTTSDSTGVITDVTATAEYSKATVTWKHSREQASTSLIYGGTRTTMDTKAEITKRDDGSYSATLVGLKPGVRYFFSINSEDAAKKTSTWDSLVVARGYPVEIIVTENETPTENATVEIGSISRKTNKEGKVTVELAQGNYNVSLTTESEASKTVNFTVSSKDVPANGNAPVTQSYSFNVESEEGNSSDAGGMSLLTFIFVLIGGGAVMVIGVLGYLAYRRRQYEGSYTTTDSISTGPSVIIDDGYDWRQQQPPSIDTPLPPPPPSSAYTPGARADDYEEPKDMFQLAKEREERDRE